MKTGIWQVCYLLLALLLPGVAAADMETNRSVFEKTWQFVDRSYGFSLNVPVQFELTGDEAGMLYFQSAETSGLIVVRPADDVGLADLQRLMRGGIETGLALISTNGSPVTLDVQGGQGMAMAADGFFRRQPIKGVLAGIVAPEGRGYVVFVGAIASEWPILEPRALPLLRSFSVIPTEPGFEHERWRYRLAGKRLIFVAGYGRPFNGAAVAADITLCADGRFRAWKGSGTYDHDPLWGSYYSSTGSKKAGTWRTGQNGMPYLRLDFKRGGDRTAPLEYLDGFIFMDGRPYEATPASCD